MKKFIFFAALFTVCVIEANGQATGAPYPPAPPSGEFVTGYSPQSLDSMLMQMHTESAVKTFYKQFDDFARLDPKEKLKSSEPDSIYKARLAALLSPIGMPWNSIVRNFIVSYTTRRKQTMSTMLARSQYYFPMIEQELTNHGIPLELKILPIVESSLTPTARSRAGAMGLWQFMPATGRGYGLEITTFVDMRCDPVASTRAACRFLKDLYRMYKDWTLALAAYNCGPGNVNKALALAGAEATSFWDIYPYLPQETRDYVPAFIAATYTYNYHKQYDIEVGAVKLVPAVDTVMVDRVMHLGQVAETLSLPMETLKALNPAYLQDVIPALDKHYALVLPMDHLSKYVLAKNEIIAKEDKYLSEYFNPDNVDEARLVLMKTTTTHVVKSGENLGIISKKYGVKESQIIKWNNLKNPNRLSVGQKLEIQK